MALRVVPSGHRRRRPTKQCDGGIVESPG